MILDLMAIMLLPYRNPISVKCRVSLCCCVSDIKFSLGTFCCLGQLKVEQQQNVTRKKATISIKISNHYTHFQSFEWQSARGALYWSFNGETLAERRSRMEDEELNVP